MREPETPRRFASILDAASYAACSERTVRRWIERGLIARHGYGQRMVRVDLNDVDRLLSEGVRDR